MPLKNNGKVTGVVSASQLLRVWCSVDGTEMCDLGGQGTFKLTVHKLSRGGEEVEVIEVTATATRRGRLVMRNAVLALGCS